MTASAPAGIGAPVRMRNVQPPRSSGFPERAVCGNGASDLQSDRKFCDKRGCIDGVSIHRAVIEARQRRIRLDALGQDPPCRAGQVDEFGLGQGPRLRKSDAERLLHRDQIVTFQANARIGGCL